MANRTTTGLGSQGDPVHVNVRENLWTKPAVAFTGLALLVSVGTLLVTLAPWGSVRPIEPSSYAVLREDPLVGEVEHLVVPLEWQNGKGRTVLIRNPRLVVCEFREGEECEPDAHMFCLVREYKDISGRAFSREDCGHKGSLALEPHSVSANVLAFRILDRNADGLRFLAGEEYRVEIDYLQDTANEPSGEPRLLGHFCLTGEGCGSEGATAAMAGHGNVRWNWWPVDEYHESCEGQTA
jgi:hypothetical protein